jgi:hypothetical protein
MIVSGNIAVGVDSYEYRKFVTLEDASKPIVRGNFIVGGSYNDIHVLILDADGFDRWKVGVSPEKVYYSSAFAVTGDLEANVPKGETLYLIFDNTFTANSEKIVTADIELAYLR